MSRSRPTLLVVALLSAALAPASGHAQTEQYVSSDRIRYRSLPDTGSVKRAASAYRRDPSVQNAIALGTAQAGVRQFREAIKTFTRALDRFPDAALLYRWRGHRYLTLRDFVRARADLEIAIGLDSALYGAWYHLGIVHFADGEFGRATEAFTRALPLAPDAAERAGSTDWLWMSISRAGDAESAAALLASRPDSIPAGNAYAKRLALYRGAIPSDAVFAADDTADVQRATLSYGLGDWYLVQRDTALARLWFERAVASGGWPAFGAIVAEAELAGRTTSLNRALHERLSSSCLRALPPSDLTRTVASAVISWGPQPVMPSAMEREMLGQAALILQESAEVLRRTLGGAAGTLPAGDPRYSWRDLKGTLLLVLHRDGRASALAYPDHASDDRASMPAIIALEGAFAAARAEGAATFVWTDALDSDSLVVPVRIEYPEEFGPEGIPADERSSIQIPLFSVPVPTGMKPVRPMPGGTAHYPTESRMAGAEATVLLQFIVDTTGRVRPESIRERWDTRIPRQRGTLARHYDAFRAEVIALMPEARFQPAEIAGCKVPQLVQQPFVFDIVR